ncbi:helicase-associated domain-containing protein [Micromonospora sp. CPCC 206061]|uniref:helicase-associated domain-containing protein n=1 Tax=Micromonospora sp. CPCC 206061 TaxID=3122410 RepID=UPI002FF2496D
MRRPDTMAAPAVTTLSALAGRLQDGESVSVAIGSLPRPALQLIEAMQAFGPPTVGTDQLAAAVGRTPDDPEFAATLRVLSQRALMWPDGDDLRMAGPLWTAFEYPLNLGGPVKRLLEGYPVSELREVAIALGLPGGRTRQKTWTAVCAALADGERVTALVAAAPDGARELLTAVAWRGPLVAMPAYARPTTGPLAWALRHGLLISDGWQHAQMPGEVGRALRGPQWRAPFDPRPPSPRLTAAPAQAVAREAAAAASAAVEQAAAVFGAAPVTLLKSGGVGARELRRLAKSAGCGESQVRLWLELGYAAGLLGIAEARVLPTDAYDEWCVTSPAGRLQPLLRAWPRLPAAPLVPEPGPALVRDAAGLAAYDLRPALLDALAELPDGQGAAEGLADVLGWRSPLLADPDEPLLDALWEEARLIGAVAHGALTPLGRPLVDERASLAVAAEDLLPPPVSEALFQNDLTAVVPGAPAAALAALLDDAATRESRGGATTWRFSTASVRAALDAGRTPEALVDALRSAAVGGALPQVLEYLVADVGRQHGRLRVREVGCVLYADDPALVAEVAGAKALRPLGLAVLAPTVLTSVRPLVETLTALRSAGYAPIGEDASGAAAIERPVRRRAPVPRRPPSRTAVKPPKPAELAARLLEPPVSALHHVQVAAPHLGDGEQRLLAAAVDGGIAVTIAYTDAQGSMSQRVIEPLDLDGPMLAAWCHLRDDERMFLLDRIGGVTPA